MHQHKMLTEREKKLSTVRNKISNKQNTFYLQKSLVSKSKNELNLAAEISAFGKSFFCTNEKGSHHIPCMVVLFK